MKPEIDHEAAQKWAEEMLRLDSVSPLWKTGNAAACYLDAMAQRDKATELLRELIDGLVPCNEPVEPGSVVARVDAFLDERK